MPCNGCKFWNPLPTDDGTKERYKAVLGECRRHSPVPGSGAMDEGEHSHWPITLKEDWCGDLVPATPGTRLARKDTHAKY